MRAFIVSSFPRSGNTWTRFVLATAILGRRPSSGELDSTTVDLHKPIPPVADWIKRPGLILKSHFDPGHLQAFLRPFFANEARTLGVDSVKVVHIVRNPFDVAVSVKRYYEAPDESFDRFLKAFFLPGPVFPPNFIEWGFGSWHSNNAQWLRQAQLQGGDVRIVRYEDLTSDPEGGFGDILNAFGVEPKLPIADCVALCAPAALRRLEQDEVANGEAGLFAKYRKGKQAGTRFINEATAGGFRRLLTPDQIRYGVERLSPLLSELGYDPAGFLAETPEAA